MITVKYAMALLALSPVASSAAAQSVSPPDAQQGQIAQLARELVDAALALPTDSEVRAYEAQFTLVVDRSKLECRQVLEAIRLAQADRRLNVASRTALRNLSGSLAICRKGTGAGPSGGNGLNNVGLPSFSVGGGTDYGT